MRELASVGLTTREACGDTVRNVQGCHLAGACPFEVLDISAVGRGRVPALPAPPARPAPAPQVQDQLLRLRHRLRPGDVQRRRRHRRRPHATTTATSRPASACSSPAASAPTRTPRWRSRSSPPARTCCRRSRRSCGSFNHYGNRDNKLRARMKWLVDTMGWDELQARILKERRFLLASSSWPGGIPEVVAEARRRPAGAARHDRGDADGPGHARVSLRGTTPLPALGRRQRRPGHGQGHGLGVRLLPARRRHRPTSSGRWPPSSASSAPRCGSPTARTSCSGASPRSSCPKLFDRLDRHRHGRARRRAGPRRRRLPGRRHLQPGRHPEPRPGRRHRPALEEDGLADVGGVRTNISGCTNSCGQHHISDIGFFGAERRAHGKPAPGYQMLLGGYVGQTQIHFGEKALRLPAKNAPEAAVRVVRRFAAERGAGETFRGWLDRGGGVAVIAEDLRDLDEFPTPEDGPDYYVDYDETGPVRRRDRRVGVRHVIYEPCSLGDRAAVHRRRAGRAQPRVRAAARVEDHPVGGRQLLAPPVPHGVDDRRRARRPGREGGPGHRGGVHRHRLPLPRDARHGREGAAPLRPEPADDDRADPRRGAVGASTRRTAARR